MNLLKLCVLLSLSLFSLHSSALILTDSRYDFKLAEGEGGLTTNMLERGYNPLTDRVNSLDLLLVLREINDDGATENPDDGTTEFVIFYTMIFGPRMVVDADVDTGPYTFSQSWSGGESTCLYWDASGEVCEWDPVGSGIFGIGISAYTDNLWVTEATWTFDITRISVDESTAVILFLLGLSILGIARRK